MNGIKSLYNNVISKITLGKLVSQRVICHIDFDYFYAQCEELRNPELKTKPVAVCVFSDRGGDSGAIATANYIARRYGVKSGMPIKFAKESSKIFLKLYFCLQILTIIQKSQRT